MLLVQNDQAEIVIGERPCPKSDKEGGKSRIKIIWDYDCHKNSALTNLVSRNTKYNIKTGKQIARKLILLPYMTAVVRNGHEEQNFNTKLS